MANPCGRLIAAASAIDRPCSARPSSHRAISFASPSLPRMRVTPEYQTASRSDIGSALLSSVCPLAITAATISSPDISPIAKRGACSDHKRIGKVSCTLPSNCGVMDNCVAAR